MKSKPSRDTYLILSPLHCRPTQLAKGVPLDPRKTQTTTWTLGKRERTHQPQTLIRKSTSEPLLK